MVSNQTGLSRTAIQHVLGTYPGILESELVGDLEATWRVTYQQDGLEPLNILIDNGINRIYIQGLVQIPSELTLEAIEATGPFDLIGVTFLAGSHFLRGTVFTDFSTVLALTGMLRTIVLAFDTLRRSLESPTDGVGGESLAHPSPEAAHTPTRTLSAPATTVSVGALSPTSMLLSKGQNAALSDSGATPHLSVRIRWVLDPTAGTEPELDASAIVAGSDDRVLSDAHFIFFNNSSSPEGSVRTIDETGAGNRVTFSVDTASLPVSAAKVVIALAIYSAEERGQSFQQVSRVIIEVLNADSEAGLLAFEIVDARTETAMILGELYRHRDAWKFRAIGQGYSSGLAGIATDYAVNID